MIFLRDGSKTIRLIGHNERLLRFLNNDEDFVTPTDMLSELQVDEKALKSRMRAVHTLSDDLRDRCPRKPPGELD